jgi:site-specific DNA-adenine methylase
MATGKLKSPYPWFGGKSRIASVVWQRFGRVRNYCEPFFGSGAVLLQRPTPFDGVETINDKDGYVANFWRALQAEPDAVARHADWPINENDLHARNAWLADHRGSMQERLESDPRWYDVEAAGWWAWGLGCWIGGGWALLKHRRRPQLMHGGQGLHRTSVHDNRAYLHSLSDRLRRVRVCCGDWSRVVTDATTIDSHDRTAVFLDPPYSAESNRDESIYSVEDLSIAHATRDWCLSKGGDPRWRIALCGFEGEHDGLEAVGWDVFAWATQGGMAKGRDAGGLTNARRERVWFSPHCLESDSMPLFAELDAST